MSDQTTELRALAVEVLRVHRYPGKYPITAAEGWSVLVNMAEAALASSSPASAAQMPDFSTMCLACGELFSQHKVINGLYYCVENATSPEPGQGQRAIENPLPPCGECGSTKILHVLGCSYAHKSDAHVAAEAAPTQALTFEEWWTKRHTFSTDSDRLDWFVHALSGPFIAIRSEAEAAWTAARQAALEEACRAICPGCRLGEVVARQEPRLPLEHFDYGPTMECKAIKIRKLLPDPDCDIRALAAQQNEGK